MFKGVFDKNNTLKPKKKHQSSLRQELHKHAKATLGAGDLSGAVKLPQNYDINEWLATNTVDFYNQMNILYGTIQKYCTKTSCPLMAAGKYEYLWAVDKNSKPEAVSAPEYVNLLMNWIQSLLDDPSVFPETIDIPFPKTFVNTIKNIFKKLFRVYAHIYFSHFRDIVQSGIEAHLNTCFKHFYLFITEFSLVPEKELEPLRELIENLFKNTDKVSPITRFQKEPKKEDPKKEEVKKDDVKKEDSKSPTVEKEPKKEVRSPITEKEPKKDDVKSPITEKEKSSLSTENKHKSKPAPPPAAVTTDDGYVEKKSNSKPLPEIPGKSGPGRKPSAEPDATPFPNAKRAPAPYDKPTVIQKDQQK